MPVASPYAVFRAPSHPAGRPWAADLTWVSAPTPAPAPAPFPARMAPRRRRTRQAPGLVQGELFASVAGGGQCGTAQAADCFSA